MGTPLISDIQIESNHCDEHNRDIEFVALFGELFIQAFFEVGAD
jgi:hypothetical protein